MGRVRSWTTWAIIRGGKLINVCSDKKLLESMATYTDEVVPLICHEGLSCSEVDFKVSGALKEAAIQEVSKMSSINPAHHCPGLSQEDKAKTIVSVVLQKLGIIHE